MYGVGSTQTLVEINNTWLLQVLHSPHLASVTQDAFMANTALEDVQIRDNPKLTEISLDAFSHLYHLKHLSLNNNSLLSIYLDKRINDTERLFVHLSELDISNNPLVRLFKDTLHLQS